MSSTSADYLRPSSVQEAIGALVRYGADAVLLAGGQSLLPSLELRPVPPAYLVDLGGIEALRGVRMDGTELVIGAMTTREVLLADPLVRAHAELVRQATATVADSDVRRRGTLGGSLAQGDPAGDLSAVALALDAVMVAQGPAGRRTIGAAQFFQGYQRTALARDEVLVEVRLANLAGQWGFHYEKFHHVAEDWAIVGVAAAVRREDAIISDARIALANMGPTPVRASATEGMLAGVPASPEAVRDAAELAVDDLQPEADLGAQADYRAHLARMLTGRAIEKAVGLWEPSRPRPIRQLPGL